MFPLPISTWIMIGLSALALAGFGYGRYESAKYDAFKAKVELVAKEQEAKNDSITKQNQLVTEGVKNEYKAKLSALHTYYGGLLNNTSGGSMSTLPTTTERVDVTPANAVLAGQCAETTAQLTSLQDWVQKQIGISNAK